MNKDSKIYVAGHTGLVGSAIVRELTKQGYNNLILRTSLEVDLINQKQVAYFFSQHRPEYVFNASGRVGGIGINSILPAQFIYENLLMEANLIECCRKYKIKKLVYLGSSCIYPRECPQPIKEEYLLSGSLEPTNEPYAIAKIAGIKMCQAYNKQYGTNFISAMPTNLYGPNDNFGLTSRHVLPAMIRKFDDAKKLNQEVVLWGSGKPRREFLYVDDLADALVFLMNNYDSSEIINVGTGEDISIKELAEMIKNVTGFEGEIIWDSTKPDGTPQKLLDVSKIYKLGWRSKTELEDGINLTYKWYAENLGKL